MSLNEKYEKIAKRAIEYLRWVYEVNDGVPVGSDKINADIISEKICECIQLLTKVVEPSGYGKPEVHDQAWDAFDWLDRSIPMIEPYRQVSNENVKKLVSSLKKGDTQ